MRHLPGPLVAATLLALLLSSVPCEGTPYRTSQAADSYNSPTELLVHLLLNESRDSCRITVSDAAILVTSGESLDCERGAALEFFPVPGSDRMLVFASGRLVTSGADIVVRSTGSFRVSGIKEPVGPANGLRLFREKDSIRCVLRVGLSAYIEGVLIGEMGDAAPLEALKAQAVASRTYVARRMNEKGIAFRHHLGGTTLHQVYRHAKAPARIREAVAATEGEIVTWRGRPALTLYSACCGGMSEASEAAFGGSATPYLTPLLDRPEGARTTRRIDSLAALDPASCAGDPLFRWKRKATAERIRILFGLKETPDSLRVTTRHDSGRVKRITAAIRDGASKAISGTSFRSGLDLPSTLLFVENCKDGTFLLHGAGFGHGVGLCQSGAKGLARRGLTYQAILDFYYPGTEILRIY